MRKHRAGSSWLQDLVTVNFFNVVSLIHVDLQKVLNDIAPGRVVSSQH